MTKGVARHWRLERANELLREIIGDFLIRRLRDPRLQFVTITEVHLSPDFQHGKVYFSVLGGKGQEREALRALERAEPLIREEINRNVRWRFIPRLTFVVDKRLEEASHVLALLDKIAGDQGGKEPPSDPSRRRKGKSHAGS